MMMAIYHANPRAFIKNNINRLKKGAILRIPNKDDILALEKRAAQKEYKRHVEAWHADTEIVRPDPGPVPAPEPMPEVMPEPEQEQPAVAQEAETAAEAPAPEAEAKMVEEAAPEAEAGELKIATARPEGEGEAGPSEDSEADKTIARLKQELMITEEDSERSRGEGEELSSRVDDLENQLEDIDRLLELKSEQLANMQAALARSQEEQGFLERNNKQLSGELARSKEEATAEPEPVVEESAPEVVKGESDTEIVIEETKPEPMVEETKLEPMVEETKLEPMVEETKPEPMVEEAKLEPMVEETKPEPMVEEAKLEPMVEEAKPESMVEEAKQDSVVKPMAKTEPEPVKAAAKPVLKQQAEEPGLLDAIMGNPTMLGIVVGVIIILLALAWILLSRKRANATDFQESILLNTSDDEDAGVMAEADDIPSHTEETSFLSDFSPSDIDALQDETGEVDPLSEADVYIAYGRYQQAEELIRQAIDKEPERGVLKYKLFEILYAVKNSDGFIALAEESAGTTVESSDSESWNKVLSMGKMLSPEHAMFSSAEDITADDDLFTLDDDLLDEELDENDFADLDATLTQAGFSVDQETSGAGTESESEADVIEMDDDQLDNELLNLANELDESADSMEDSALDLDDTLSELDDLEFDTNLDDDSLSVALDELEGLGGAEPIVEKQEDEKQDDGLGSADDLMLSLADLEDESEKTVLSLHADSMELDGAEEVVSGLDLDLEKEASSLEAELLANEPEKTVLSLQADSMELDGAEEIVSGLDLEIADEASSLEAELLANEPEKTVLSLQTDSMELDDAEEIVSGLDLEIADEASSLEEDLLANELEETVIDFPEDNSGKAQFELDDPMAGLDTPEDIDAAEDMEVNTSVDEDLQDEVKTKLDLARAYAEMGDSDGAMDILDEVMSEGDETQKQEAQQIRESLS